jgi:hypothetical protein
MTPNPVPPAAAPEPSPPPANKTRTVLKWVALVLAVPLALCLVLGATVLFFDKTQKKTPLSDVERGALLTAEDLVSAGAKFTPDPKIEVASRNANVDGSNELSYEYESKDPPVYVSTMVSLEKSDADAMTSYTSQSVGGAVGMNLSEPKMGLEDRDDLLKWGDQSRARLITYDGKPVGNFFIARKNNRVFLTMFTGVYFDDPEDFRAIVEPKLDAMAGLQTSTQASSGPVDYSTFVAVSVAVPIGIVAVLLWQLIRGRRGESGRRKREAEYEAALRALADSPGDPARRIAALQAGRAHYGGLRPGGTPTIYDEQAVANDISARTGGK